MFSYHIFYFPFKWKIKGRENLLFSEQTRLDNVKWSIYTNWLESPEITNEQELNELYNEKNYYYEFVHHALYDTKENSSILKHFERKEPQPGGVTYTISKKGGRTYILKVDAINLNLYETGVGMLTFFLKNEQENQKAPEDILNINQYGRRIFPPFIADVDNRYEIAEYISIEGLNGSPADFREDFNQYTNKHPWKPACFIINLIVDLYDEFEIKPVIDDRMFVNCWYGNDNLSGEVAKSPNEFIHDDDFWYKYVYVDVSSPSCKNEEMRLKLLREQSYTRWQKDGMLYGVSRYSFVFLTKNDGFQNTVLAAYMRTIYSRMVELILIQRASILRFSEEVTRLSCLSKNNNMEKDVIEQISSLYKEYIRFINQVHFREVTTQDQGIELYNLMSDTLKIKGYVQDLDKEIEELYQYVNMLDDKIRNRNAEILNIIAAIFLPATLFAGIFSINHVCIPILPFTIKILIIAGAGALMYLILKLIKKNK